MKRVATAVATFILLAYLQTSAFFSSAKVKLLPRSKKNAFQLLHISLKRRIFAPDP